MSCCRPKRSPRPREFIHQGHWMPAPKAAQQHASYQGTRLAEGSQIGAHLGLCRYERRPSGWIE